MKNKTLIIKIDDLKLLPQTYEFFDNSGELSFYIEVIIEEPYFYTSDRKKINISSRLCSEAYIFISRKSILKLLFEKLNFVI